MFCRFDRPCHPCNGDEEPWDHEGGGAATARNAVVVGGFVEEVVVHVATDGRCGVFIERSSGIDDEVAAGTEAVTAEFLGLPKMVC